MLYLGLRQGEVAARVARDIDDEGAYCGFRLERRRMRDGGSRFLSKSVHWCWHEFKGKSPTNCSSILRIIRPTELDTSGCSSRGSAVWLVFRLSVRTACEECTRRLRWKGRNRGRGGQGARSRQLRVTKTHYASASSVANNQADRVAATLAGESRGTVLSELLKSSAKKS